MRLDVACARKRGCMDASVIDHDVIKAGSKENALLLVQITNTLIQHTKVVLRIVLQVKSILEAV